MSAVTIDTPFTPADDCYHLQDKDNPLNLETNWWCFNIPERRIGCWLHAAYYPNRGDVTWRVFVWDDRGWEPTRAAYYKKAEGMAMPADPDLRDITFPGGGYSLKMLKPLMDYQLGYVDKARNFAIEFEFTALHPPHRFTPGEPPAMHNPHIDQLGRFKGEMTLLGEKLAIDCLSVRDRTWGPREGAAASSQKPEYLRGEYKVREPGGPRWREIERERGRGKIQYIFGHSDDGQTGFLSFVRPQDGDAKGRSPMNMGWLLKDGRFTRMDKTRAWMKNWRDVDTGFSQHMEVLCVDVAGRTLEAEGVSVSRFSEHGAGGTASLFRWEMEGKIGWGEDQDGFRQQDQFIKMRDALQAWRR